MKPKTRKRPRPSTWEDRFVARRRPADWIFAYYYEEKSHHQCLEENDILTQDMRETRKQAYRRNLRKALGFPCGSLRLVFPITGRTLSGDAGSAMWPVRRRKKPLMNTPDCALDLPEFKGLYYYDLLDWGATGYLAAALNWSVFLCHPETNKTIHLTEIDNSHRTDGGEYGTALKWDSTGKRLVIGTNKSIIQVWDTQNKKLETDMWCTCIYRQTCTITSLAWSVCNKRLVSGCSSGKLSLVTISNNGAIGDFRVAHDGNVSTLCCSPDGRYLASAGSDNIVRLWLWPQLSPYFEITYDYPARAMAWHPWKPAMFAIGGGVNNGTISIYNVNNCTKIATSTPRTKSIVLSLAWSTCTGELVASYWVMKDLDSSRSNNGHTQILVLSNLNNVVDKFMLGYSTHVMYLLWSPDGRKIATASTDETLRIWSFTDLHPGKKFDDAQRKRNCKSGDASKLFDRYIVR